MIEDITEEERGKNCNCVCPSCEGHFIARLKDDKRRKHFAHDGEACDEVKAYLTGLYLLLQEYLQSNNPLILPGVGFFFSLESKTEVSENQIEFIDDYHTRSPDYIELTKGACLLFDHVEIVKDGKGYPEAILAVKDQHKLALVIKPPDTVCKDFVVRSYGGISTVSIVLDDYEWIHSATKQVLFDAIRDKVIQIHWVYNATWENQKEEIQRRRLEYQRIKEQERIEKRRKEQELLRQERLERKRKYQEQRRQQQEESEKNGLTHTQDAKNRERLSKAYLEREGKLQPDTSSRDAHKKIDYRLPSIGIMGLLDQQEVIAIDQNGKRWKRCGECRKFGLTDQLFTDYESPLGQNIGLCKECAEKNK